MRTWTGRKLSLVVVGALWMLGGAACITTNPGDPDDGGQGGSGDTATATTTTTGGEGGSPPACDTKQIATDAAFAPTSGPEPWRFAQVAATSKVVLVTTGSGIHRSKDGGETWKLLTTPGIHGEKISAMTSLGDEIFVIAGEAILRSTDGGDTWEDTSTADCTAAHHLNASGGALFALSFGMPFRWNAAEETWDALPNDDLEDMHLGFDIVESDGHYLYGNSLYQPGVHQIDLTTLTKESKWALVEDLPEWGYKALAFSGGKGFAANATQVFRSDDEGATWKALESDAPADVQDFLTVGGAVFAAGSSGLHVTTDGGGKWDKAIAGPFSSEFALATDGEHVFSASDALRRANGANGAWEKLHVLADSVWMLSAAKGAVLSASNGGSFFTKDGGATWEPIQLPAGEALSFRSRAVLRDDKVFAHGFQSLLVSSDDGASFQAKAIAPAAGQYGYVSMLASIDAGLVIGLTKSAGTGCSSVQGVTTTLYVSSDQGDTWTPAMNAFPVAFTDCYGQDHAPMITGLVQVGGALLATNYLGGAYRSEDGGKSWVPVTLAEIGEPVHFGQAGGAVLAALKEGGVARSGDGGKTWEKTGFEGGVVSSFAEAGDTVFASVGSIYEPGGGGVFYSADGGVSWHRADAGFDARVQSMTVLGDGLYAGTVDQSTWRVDLACAAGN